MTFDADQLNAFVLFGAAVTFLAILAVRVSSRVGMPSLLIYLLMGIALGESGLGIPFEDVELANAVAYGALAIILAEGGLTTDWRQMRSSIRLGTSLATIGLAVSVTVVAVASHYLLGLPWQLAVLLAAVCSPTDSAAVFSVLRVVPLPRRLTGALEAESGLNDAPTVVLVTVISSGLAGGSPWMIAGAIVFQLVVGVVVGLAGGLGGAWLVRRVALPSSGLYPLAVLCLAFIAYGAATGIQASGFVAVYVAGLVLGNSELPHRVATRSFAEGVAWLAQIGLFVMLGLLMSPGRITGTTVAYAVVTGLVLTFVARPLSVVLSAVVQPMGWRDLGFLSWAGLRGAVPIVLTTIPLAEGVEGASELFDIVFVMVIVYTLVTGPTLPWAARLLGVARRAEPRGVDIEVAPLDRVAADLLQVTITDSSRLHGVEVGELRLPQGASVSLIVRGGELLVPERRSVLRHGDDLLVVTPRHHREATQDRLRQVSVHGRLAKWLREPRRGR